jgi:hypothetical protein
VGAARPTLATANAITAFRNISILRLRFSLPTYEGQVAIVLDNCYWRQRVSRSTQREAHLIKCQKANKMSESVWRVGQMSDATSGTSMRGWAYASPRIA